MKSDKLEIADLLAEESFINYCKKSSNTDVAYWENYINENPRHLEVIEQAREKYIQLLNALADADLEEQVARLSNRLEMMETSEQAAVIPIDKFGSRNKGRKLRLFLKIAAAVLLPVAVFIAINYTNGGTKTVRTYQAAYGERKNLQLPDGSDISLNAGSKIEINGDFGKTRRDVYLEGEAFFDVKHNEKLPFIVHTQAMDVKALGTAFNVKAYGGGKNTETSLIRGLIEVTLKENNNETMLLYPNQKIQWDPSLVQNGRPLSGDVQNGNKPVAAVNLVKKLLVSDDGNIKEIAWKDNKLDFDNDLFSEIAELLERWYGVEIEFSDPSLRNYRFTATFEKEDINTVLDQFKESKAFSYRVEHSEPLKIYLFK